MFIIVPVGATGAAAVRPGAGQSRRGILRSPPESRKSKRPRNRPENRRGPARAPDLPGPSRPPADRESPHEACDLSAGSPPDLWHDSKRAGSRLRSIGTDLETSSRDGNRPDGVAVSYGSHQTALFSLL